MEIQPLNPAWWEFLCIHFALHKNLFTQNCNFHIGKESFANIPIMEIVMKIELDTNSLLTKWIRQI